MWCDVINDTKQYNVISLDTIRCNVMMQCDAIAWDAMRPDVAISSDSPAASSAILPTQTVVRSFRLYCDTMQSDGMRCDGMEYRIG
eukprot:scaffold192685_cov40-Prasinocladus_malaysianus.AAC.1